MGWTQAVTLACSGSNRATNGAYGRSRNGETSEVPARGRTLATGRSVAAKDRVREGAEVSEADKNEPPPPVERRQDVGGVKDREEKHDQQDDNDRASLVPLPREPTPQRHSSDRFSASSARPACCVGSPSLAIFSEPL